MEDIFVLSSVSVYSTTGEIYLGSHVFRTERDAYEAMLKSAWEDLYEVSGEIVDTSAGKEAFDDFIFRLRADGQYCGAFIDDTSGYLRYGDAEFVYKIQEFLV